MNLYICGFIDIILIVTFIVFIIIGYKEGLLIKILNMSKGIVGVILSFFLVLPLGKALYNVSFIRDPIYNRVEPNVVEKIEECGIDASTDDLLEALGFPDFMSYIIEKVTHRELTTEAFVDNISYGLTQLVLYFVSLIFLIFMLTIGISILKVVVKGLRHNKIIKVTDGILGVIVNVVIYLFITYIILLSISLAIQMVGPSSRFTEFITTDMQLDNNNFRLSKYFYNNNIIGSVFELFF